eukprot:484858_1
MIQKPLNMKIQSNIKSIVFGPVDVSKLTGIQIPLNIHSHKGHDSDCKPERMLQADTSYYLSPSKQVTNDWIIMETNDNNIYCPIKIELVGYSGGVDEGYGPGNFQLKIGNSSSNEWIDCNQQVLTG